METRTSTYNQVVIDFHYIRAVTIIALEFSVMYEFRIECLGTI